MRNEDLLNDRPKLPDKKFVGNRRPVADDRGLVIIRKSPIKQDGDIVGYRHERIKKRRFTNLSGGSKNARKSVNRQGGHLPVLVENPIPAIAADLGYVPYIVENVTDKETGEKYVRKTYIDAKKSIPPNVVDVGKRTQKRKEYRQLVNSQESTIISSVVELEVIQKIRRNFLKAR